MTWILYLLAIMVFYDFSLHVYDFLIHLNVTKKKHPFGLWRLWNLISKDNNEKRQRAYDIFWTSYWGIASILFIAYLIYR